MKKGNSIAILISLSFVFWLVVSITQPIIKIFNNTSTFDYVSMLNNLFILSAMVLTVVPKAFKKRDNLGDLDLKTGSKTSNAKYGCKSCKKKKK